MEPTRDMYRLEVVSDTICPWCNVGKHRLAKALTELEPELSFEVIWRPFELNPNMPRNGMDRRAYRFAKFGSWQRSQALDAQVTGIGALEGIVLRHDLITRTPNTFGSHRLIELAGREGVQDAVVEAIFSAYFTEGRDIGQHGVLTDIATSNGLSEARVVAFLAGDEGIDDVIRKKEHGLKSGIQGVPSFLLEGAYLFSGALSTAQMVKSLRQAVEHLGSGQSIGSRDA